MTRNDLILTLVRAGAAGDKALLRSTVETLAAEERAKKNTTLADRLIRAVQANGHAVAAASLNGGGMSTKGGQAFLFESHPQRALAELTLLPVVRREIENLVEEQFRADLLRSLPRSCGML